MDEEKPCEDEQQAEGGEQKLSKNQLKKLAKGKVRMDFLLTVVGTMQKSNDD